MRISNNLIELASDSVRLTAKLVDSTPSEWRSFVPPDDIANAASIERQYLSIALERCAAVFNNLTGDLAKRAPIIRLRWDAATMDANIYVSFGDIKTAPAAMDVVDAQALQGKADISVNPKMLMRLLEKLEEDEGGCDIVTLQAGTQSGDPLRVNAGDNRFVVLSQVRDFSHLAEEAA